MTSIVLKYHDWSYVFDNNNGSLKVLQQHESWKMFLHKAPEPTETNPLTWQNVLGLFVLSLQPINLQHCMPDGVTLAESHPGLVFLDRRWAQRSPWAPWQSGEIRYLFVPPAGMSRVARAQTACWGSAEEEVKLLEKKGMVEFLCAISTTHKRTGSQLTLTRCSSWMQPFFPSNFQLIKARTTFPWCWFCFEVDLLCNL